jgi:hypothetical protein
MRVLEDVEHGLALLAEAFVRVVQVAHDVEEGAAALLRLMDAPLEVGDALTQLLRRPVGAGVRERLGVGH